MHPYLNQDFLIFVFTLWHRFFLFISGDLSISELVSEDMQLLSLMLSGILGIFVGFYLIYNKITMLANSLSHTVLLGLVLTFLGARFFDKRLGVDDLGFYLQLIAASITAIFTMTGLKFLLKRVSNEAANALSFTAYFAVGILLTSVVLKNTHLGLEAVVGNLEAVSVGDVKNLFFALVIVSCLFFLIKTKLTLVSFDEVFAKTIGLKVGFYKNLLIFISSLVLMVCFRSMGVILILSMLTSPVLIARLWTCARNKIIIFSFLVLIMQITITLALVQALYTSYQLPVSTSGLYGFLGLMSYGIAKVLKIWGERLIQRFSPKGMD